MNKSEKKSKVPPEPGSTNDSNEKGMGRGNPNMWMFMAVVMTVMVALLWFQSQQTSTIREDFFFEQLREDNVAQITYVADNKLLGLFRKPPATPAKYNEKGELVPPPKKNNEVVPLKQRFSVELNRNMSEERKKELEQLLATNQVHQIHQSVEDRYGLLMVLGSVILPILILVFLWNMFRRTRDQLMGGGFLSGFSKSTARRYEHGESRITFDDVAGLEGVKSDLQELVDFLREPKKFQRLGGRVPKGVLLNGPPGTGKTLLARAVAGEADVPFYTVNGSEFIQMFVGVGASRVRDLFKNAKDTGPSIIFIDEIDAVGRQRGAGLGGGHDEREQTLNQILSEMDGFAPSDSVIVMAATNRPDVLDPALLRPGRFDRHITVDRPTLKGRLAIFKVHVRNVPLSDDVDLERLAAGTVGLTGADIRNMVNEAALWATRNDKNFVSMDDFEHARDKILMGPKREEILTEEDKEKTAYHEAGHALIAWLTRGNDRVHKVTVIPRGRALGVTQTLPEEDRMNVCEHELGDRLAFILGGRAAEKLVYDEFSAGAENDLERGTQMARRMVTKWGMSDRLGPVSYKLSDDDPFLGREIHQQRQFSEHTLQIIDEEVAEILHASSDRALELLSKNRDKLDALASALVEKEEISESDIRELIGPPAQDHDVKRKKPTTIAPEEVTM